MFFPTISDHISLTSKKRKKKQTNR